MPLINTFLWVTLVLVILLSLQLVNSYRQAEQEIMRKSCKTHRHNCDVLRRPLEQNTFCPRSSNNAFLTVGQSSGCSVSSTVNYYLPASQSISPLNQPSKMAAVTDCQTCA